MPEQPASIPNIVDVELLRGAEHEGGAPSLLVEVPHGADERAHYEQLRGRLRGALPEDLEEFFFVNTDVGAWAYGRATAQALLAAEPKRAALIVRSLIPRTFVDCNRPADYGDGRLGEGALTPGIPPYVRDADDRALLTTLHRRYVEAARQAYALVCGAGGLALVPHTYGPRTLGIDAIDDEIITKLRWACAPDRHDSWPLRAEVDLLTRDAEGRCYAPEGLEQALLDAFAAAGFSPVANEAYYIHPSTLGYTWSAQYPGQVLCLELRRDLLVAAWTPLAAMHVDAGKCARVAEVLAPALRERLTGGR
ncbi:hypothetical protein G6O69_12445 [Pseudenhygromyxa sp. WMMC2535]|uniref:hypothetical protein n=1 Tax=Pseudenhygromyxa sp. WMMC2535 TaxID=2712867 RepID=UPI0015561062|nr:hypothetical protein [Pseudenhygromyxa sp. WMMC2535]NVB38642.1 hypothetical protein [Pseudenhygromyxa sp. WMMC2535]